MPVHLSSLSVSGTSFTDTPDSLTHQSSFIQLPCSPDARSEYILNFYPTNQFERYFGWDVQGHCTSRPLLDYSHLKTFGVLFSPRETKGDLEQGEVNHDMLLSKVMCTSSQFRAELVQAPNEIFMAFSIPNALTTQPNTCCPYLSGQSHLNSAPPTITSSHTPSTWQDGPTTPTVKRKIKRWPTLRRVHPTDLVPWYLWTTPIHVAWYLADLPLFSNLLSLQLELNFLQP